MERLNTAYSNAPIALYQNVELDVNMHNESINASTTLWLAFKEPVKNGFVIHLHARQFLIKKVLVNGLPATFTRKDGLRNLNPTKQKIYNGKELDEVYRSALEITRDGELLIVVPDLTSTEKLDLKPPKSIPKSSSREVIARYEKILKAYQSLSMDRRKYDVQDDNLMTASADSPPPANTCERTTHLLQITIEYSIQPLLPSNTSNSSHNSSHVSNYSGLVFRKTAPFAKEFERHLAAFTAPDSTTTTTSTTDSPLKKDPVQCLYSTSFTNGSLRDVDGVRCWLPCLDSLDQRLVFDLTILLSRNYHVASVGKRIPVPKQGVKVGKVWKKVHRFFTVNRIPTSQLGFFVGKVETYRMALHKTKGKIWVATGLRDFVGMGAIPASSVPVSSEANNKEKSTATSHSDATGDRVSLKRPREESTVEKSEPQGIAENKRVKASQLSPPPEKEKEAGSVVTLQTIPTPSAVSQFEEAKLSISVRRLYAEAVHHTLLGFDLAMRVIQKFINHKYEYDELTIIFIPELGRDFMASDALVFVDAKYLHTAEQIYLEMPTNCLLLKSWLYSWFATDIPLASYENEFILHGTIGYLLEFYLQEVYGEEEGSYYCQKMFDTVISLEQQGLGSPLSGMYPERYETFSFHYGQYLLAKATVLFRLIENKLGGRDTMRIALKQMVKAPPMFAATVIRSSDAGLGSPTIDLSETGLLMSPSSAAGGISPSSPTSPGGGSVYPYGYNYGGGGGGYTPGGQSPGSQGSSVLGSPLYGGGGGGGFSPYIGGGGGGYQSPYINRGDLSPYVPYGGGGGGGAGGGGSVSPYRTGGYLSGALGSFTPHLGYGYEELTSPGRAVGGVTGLALVRQYSQTSEDDWYKDAHLFESTTLTAESFILLLRNASGATSDLDESFLERYVYSSGLVLLRVQAAITPRVDGKTRTITIHTDQIGYHPTSLEFSKHHVKKLELPVILVEERDNNITRSRIMFGENRETHQQQAYAKPGRRAGKLGSLSTRKAEDLSEEELERRRQLEEEKEARKSALQLVRDREYGLRYVIVDPAVTVLADLQNHSCDVLLVEQLNANLDELGSDLERHKVYFQLQAVRSLGRANNNLSSGSAATAFTATTTSSSQLAPESPMPSSSLSLTGAGAGGVVTSSGGGGGAGGVVTSSGGGGGSNLILTSTTTGSKYPDKSAKIQVKALSDCLLGITPEGNGGSAACIFVRAEAAFALARWQNDYSSLTVLPEPRENHWLGMEALLEAVYELFLDPSTKAPLPLNFHNESSVYLRNSLLLAISSLRSQQGETPWEVVETLWLFAEDLEEMNARLVTAAASSSAAAVVAASENNTDNEETEDPDHPSAASTLPMSVPYQTTACDATHYRAVVLLALSRIRFSDVDVSSDSCHTITKIVSFAKSVLEDAFTTARTVSRLDYRPSDANFLPALPFEGMDVAAAITCLAEMDIQVAHLLSVGRGKGESCSRLLSETAASEEAIYTRLKYQSFFLPPGVSLVCLTSSASASSNSAGSKANRASQLVNNLRSHFHYFLCSPLIRLAAFEAFVRLCFALHLAHYERQRQGQSVRRFAATSSISGTAKSVSDLQSVGMARVMGGGLASPSGSHPTNSSSNPTSNSNASQRLPSSASSTSFAEGESANATSFIAAVIEAFH